MKKYLLFLFTIVTMATQAQNPGDIAQSYGTIPGFNGTIKATATQTDGKIVLGGLFTTYKGVAENYIIRLNSDGSKDTSFNTGTGFNGSILAIALQADGKMLVGGEFTTYNGIAENYIIRLNSDGSKDATFNTGTGLDNFVYSIEQQVDGKILIGGSFSTYKGVAENRIIRLNTNGSKDTSFTIGTGFNGDVRTITLQADGKILVGGDFTSYKGITENRIIRLNTGGSKDTTFATGTGFNNVVYTIAQQASGKIIVGGNFNLYNSAIENYIIRLNTNGSKDTTFAIGTGFSNAIYKIEQQTNGKILVGGLFTSYNAVSQKGIIRLNSDGSKDTTFAIGTGFDFLVNTIAQQADGKILICGNFNSYNGIAQRGIIRLNSDGSKDDTLAIGTGFSNSVRSITLQTDGKILVGGSFTSYKGSIENRITRLNTDDSKDTSFTTGTGFNIDVYTITPQTDGKILVGGEFTSYKGITENRIIRLNTDGSKDTSFATGTGFNTVVIKIVQQADGKILVGGNFITYKGITENRIIRLNTDGSKDTSFNTGTGFNNTVWTIAPQTDGKILVGGNFTSYNGVTENRIIRLNSDGSKDTSFTTGTGINGNVYDIVPLADGKILVGGNFTSYKGVAENRIIRMNTDGSKDTAFTTGTGFNNVVNSIVRQTDGKILVGGTFTSYKGVTENGIITLNTDGTKDTAFIAGTGFNSTVSKIVQQTDGKILVGGIFTTYKDDNSSANLIKLHTEQSLSTTSFDASNTFVIYPNPVQDVLHLQANNFTSIKAVKIYDLQGKVVLQGTNDTINVSNLSNGLYIIKVTTEEGEVTKKFIKE